MKSKVNKSRKSRYHRYSYKHSRCVRLISNDDAETCDDNNFIEDNIYSDTTPKTSCEDCEICPNAPHNSTSYITVLNIIEMN